MVRARLARAFQDPKSRPYLLGISIGLPLAFVIWKLLSDQHPLGLLCILGWYVFCLFCWIGHPVYRTILIAWGTATFLALVFWRP